MLQCFISKRNYFQIVGRKCSSRIAKYERYRELKCVGKCVSSWQLNKIAFRKYVNLGINEDEESKRLRGKTAGLECMSHIGSDLTDTLISFIFCHNYNLIYHFYKILKKDFISLNAKDSVFTKSYKIEFAINYYKIFCTTPTCLNYHIYDCGY